MGRLAKLLGHNVHGFKLWLSTSCRQANPIHLSKRFCHSRSHLHASRFYLTNSMCMYIFIYADAHAHADADGLHGPNLSHLPDCSALRHPTPTRFQLRAFGDLSRSSAIGRLMSTAKLHQLHQSLASNHARRGIRLCCLYQAPQKASVLRKMEKSEGIPRKQIVGKLAELKFWNPAI